MDLTKRAHQLGLEESELRAVVRIFIETSIQDVTEFDAAVERGDARKASAILHSIKGAAMNLGFHDISRMAAKMEMNARQNILEGSLEAAAVLKRKIERIADRIGKESSRQPGVKGPCQA